MKPKGSFGPLLKKLRESKGLTMQELADLAGISQVQISRLEMGHRAPLWDTVQKLARALGVRCEAFEDLPGEPKKSAAKKPKKNGE